MYQGWNISEEIEKLSIEVEKEIEPQFKEIDKICELNSLKVLQAMQNNHLSGMHLNTSTGYGIDEPGRDKIEEMINTNNLIAKQIKDIKNMIQKR